MKSIYVAAIVGIIAVLTLSAVGIEKATKARVAAEKVKTLADVREVLMDLEKRVAQLEASNFAANKAPGGEPVLVKGMTYAQAVAAMGQPKRTSKSDNVVIAEWEERTEPIIDPALGGPRAGVVKRAVRGEFVDDKCVLIEEREFNP